MNQEAHGPSVLCLHGFTGTPLSVDPLASYLGQRTYTPHVPLLDGHGRTLSDLARSRWINWYDTASVALHKAVARTGGPVAVIGYSMGGLLALKLALERPNDVSAIVLLATPLNLPRWQEMGLRFLNTYLPESWLQSPCLSWPKFGGPDISSHIAAPRDRSLRAMPIGAANSLIDLAERVRPYLGQVQQPTLLVHSTGDRVVPISASFELKRRLGSSALDFLWLERSRHLLCYDVDRETVFQTVERFLARHQSR